VQPFAAEHVHNWQYATFVEKSQIQRLKIGHRSHVGSLYKAQKYTI